MSENKPDRPIVRVFVVVGTVIAARELWLRGDQVLAVVLGVGALTALAMFRFKRLRQRRANDDL